MRVSGWLKVVSLALLLVACGDDTLPRSSSSSSEADTARVDTVEDAGSGSGDTATGADTTDEDTAVDSGSGDTTADSGSGDATIDDTTITDTTTDTGSDTAVDTGSDTGGPVLPTRPNFVVIMGEARGWTSQSTPMHEDIADSVSTIFLTPNLDSIADAGMTFSDFYAPSPRCMPSRAAFFAGRSPAQLHMTFIPEGARDGIPTGTVTPPTPLVDLPTDLDTIASLLRGQGYATAHYGKWHASKTVDPTAYGFDESDGPTANRGPTNVDNPNPSEAYLITERGATFMERAVAAGQPFYVQMSHYGGTAEIDSLPETYAATAARLPGEQVKTIADAAVVADMDITIGQVLDQLETLGIADNTYIIYTSDHGRAGANANPPLEEGKGSVWEGGIRVPLIVRGPGIPAGMHSHERASQVDILPTIAQLAEVPALPSGLEGGSLVGILTGGSGVTRARTDFVVHFPHYDKDPLGPASTIISGDYKLIHFYEDNSYRLFDLLADYQEQNDLSASDPARTASLATQLSAYLTEIGAQMPVVP